MRHAPWVSISLPVLIAFATYSWAGVALKLHSVLAHPESYQSSVIQVTGVVSNHQFQRVKKWMANVDKCVQTFTVTDGADSIQAVYGANCAGALDLLRNRDRVTLQARFDWKPGKAGMLTVQSVVSKVTPYP
ncbi:protein of unknown function [Nitrospira japonica]|uniref:Uncharacterized protein n=1 Tax=Nitrospira japonica TaxID=1325564 RepID=A0A1W1I8S0_9BACT|nr:hypothetical protein [Nitrospira japonica]SLM49404.1 protein of unknown function [Nitrospira japonica]